MYSSLPYFVLGFHGCDRTAGEDILAGKKRTRFSNNDYDWLGHGFYFWENSPTRALKYAEQVKDGLAPATQKIHEPFVVGAVIDLGNCLCLLDEKSLQVVSEAYALLEATTTKAGGALPKNGSFVEGTPLYRPLDCAVIETLHQSIRQYNATAAAGKRRREYDSVRGLFPEGEPLYTGAGFRLKDHIQICVRNPNCIKGFFRVLNEDVDYEIP